MESCQECCGRADDHFEDCKFPNLSIMAQQTFNRFRAVNVLFFDLKKPSGTKEMIEKKVVEIEGMGWRQGIVLTELGEELHLIQNPTII